MSDTIARGLGYTGTRQVFTWPASASYNNAVTVYLWGGGGGGGGNDSHIGGTGSGGGFATKKITCNPGDVIEVSVGGPGGRGYTGGGAVGGSPGLSLVQTGYVWDTRGQTSWFRVSNGNYCTWLNNYGVWNGPGGHGTYFDYTYDIGFPTTGSYTFEASCDNYGYIYVDGTLVLTIGGFYTTYSTTVRLSGGRHNVRLYGINTGGPGSIGLTINGGLAYSGGRGGYSGGGGSSGSGGGGGGATVLRINGVETCVAGGGAGGGGGGNNGAGNGMNAPNDNLTWVLTENGQDGQDKSGDGGGGGGGGGGYYGGKGGGCPGGDSGADAGRYGVNYGDFTANAVNIRPAAYATTYDKYRAAGTAWGGSVATSGSPGYAYLVFEINGTFIKVDGAWQPVKQIWVKDADVWKPVQEQYIKSGGTWYAIEGTFAPNFSLAPFNYGYSSYPYGLP